MKLLKLFLRSSPWMFAFTVALGVIAGVIGMQLVAQVNASLRRGSPAMLAWVFAALCLLRLFSALMSQLYLHRLSQRSIHELRMRLSQAILSAPLRQLEKAGAAKLLGVLTEDVLAIATGGQMLAALLAQFAFVAASAAYLAWLSAPAFGVTLVLFLAGLYVQRLLNHRSEAHFKQAHQARNRLFGGFRGITEGGKELKLHSARCADFLAEAVDPHADSFRRSSVKAAAYLATTRQWFSLLFMILVGVLIFGWMRMRPSETPILVPYVLTILYMQSTVEGMLASYGAMPNASNALKNIESLGLSIAKNPERSDSHPRPSFEKIALSGVVHEYQGEGGDGVFSLGPIDLTFEPGEIAFLIGGNGSGKSTLVKLITGLYSAQAGEILLDGQPVTEASRDSYRQLFSAVFADWFLFDRLFGIDRSGVDAESLRYLSDLRLDKKVTVRDGKFSTTALSTGQRKRLMLLTAYLEDRPIYVFDEWASDQDPVFKEVFYKQILQGLKQRGKTVIVVSHDDRYFSIADRVIRLENGHVRSARKEPSAPPAALAKGEPVAELATTET